MKFLDYSQLSKEDIISLLIEKDRELVKKDGELVKKDEELIKKDGELVKKDSLINFLTRTVKGQADTLQSKEQQIQEFKKLLKFQKGCAHCAAAEERSRQSLSPQQKKECDPILPVVEEPPQESETIEDYEQRVRQKPQKNQRKHTPRGPSLKTTSQAFKLNIELNNPLLGQGYLLEDLTYCGANEFQYLVKLPIYAVIKVTCPTYKPNGEDEKITHTPCAFAFDDKTCYDASFVANLLVNKYCHHIPLYRQHKMLEQAGIFVDRSTLTRMVQRAAQKLELIYHALGSSVLSSKILIADESPTPIYKPDKKEVKTDYYWAFYGEKQEVYFLHSPSRSHQVILDFVGENKKAYTLLSDGYSAYRAFSKKNNLVKPANCWVHASREMEKAQYTSPLEYKEIKDLISDLYDIEEEYRENKKARRKARREKSRPIVNQIFNKIRRWYENKAVPDSDPLMKACQYFLCRKKIYAVFLNSQTYPWIPTVLKELFEVLR